MEEGVGLLVSEAQAQLLEDHRENGTSSSIRPQKPLVYNYDDSDDWTDSQGINRSSDFNLSQENLNENCSVNDQSTCNELGGRGEPMTLERNSETDNGCSTWTEADVQNHQDYFSPQVDQESSDENKLTIEESVPYPITDALAEKATEVPDEVEKEFKTNEPSSEPSNECQLEDSAAEINDNGSNSMLSENIDFEKHPQVAEDGYYCTENSNEQIIDEGESVNEELVEADDSINQTVNDEIETETIEQSEVHDEMIVSEVDSANNEEVIENNAVLLQQENDDIVTGVASVDDAVEMEMEEIHRNDFNEVEEISGNTGIEEEIQENEKDLPIDEEPQNIIDTEEGASNGCVLTKEQIMDPNHETDDDESSIQEKNEGVEEVEVGRSILVSRGDPREDLHTSILEDWGGEGPHVVNGHVEGEVHIIATEEAQFDMKEGEIRVVEGEPILLDVPMEGSEFGRPLDMRSRGRISISKDEFLQELINVEQPDNLNLSGKNLFLTMELAKQERETRAALQNEKIVPKKPEARADEVPKRKTKERVVRGASRKPGSGQPVLAKAPAKINIDPQLERELALEQLNSRFLSARKRTSRQVAVAVDSPNEVAASDLGRALASTPVLAGRRKRRPCYLPEEKESEEDKNQANVIKTYAPKRKSLETNTEVETALETIAVINKHISKAQKELEDEEEEEAKTETKSPPSAKKIKKKSVDPQKRKLRELQMLLGDEGAVRMLYDTQKEGNSNSPRAGTKTMKELLQKTKFVEKAVMRLSGGSQKSLRAKRSGTSDESPNITPSSPLPSDDSLFPPASPAVSNSSSRARKKHRGAEASRILYRHSSSESFDEDGSPERGPNSPTPVRKSSRPRKLSSKFSVWAAETLGTKRVRKSEDFTDDVKKEPDFLTPKPAPALPRTPGSTAKKAVLKVDKPSPKTPLSKIQVDTPKDDVKDRLSSKGAKPATPETPAKSLRPRKQLASAVKTAKEPKSAPTRRNSGKTHIEVTRKHSVSEVSLTTDSPSIMNGLTQQVLEELRVVLEEVDADTDCRVILLTSQGVPFCQGIDLSQIGLGSDVTPLIEAIKALVTTIVRLKKVIIAGVQGPTVGLGVALLPLCDAVIASDEATFFTPYSRLSQGPEGGSSVTFPNIGTGLVYSLLHSCDTIDAADAMRLGLVSEVIPHSIFADQLQAKAKRIAQHLGSEQVKELVSANKAAAILEGLERECVALEKAWSSPDTLLVIQDFLLTANFVANS